MSLIIVMVLLAACLVGLAPPQFRRHLTYIYATLIFFMALLNICVKP
jgi:hypothetical protein